MLEFQELVPLWTFLALVIAGGTALAAIPFSTILPQISGTSERLIKMTGVFLAVGGLVTGICAPMFQEAYAMLIGLAAGVLVVVVPVVRQRVLTLVSAILCPLCLFWRAITRIYLAIVRASVTRAFPELLSETVSKLDAVEAKIEELYEAMPGDTIIGVRAKWPDLLDRVKAEDMKVEALLRSCDPLDVERNELILGFYYPFHKTRTEDPKATAVIQKCLREVLGVALKVKCVMHPKRAPDF